MEHPCMLCVGKLVRQPLRFEQIEAILAQIERLAASAKEEQSNEYRIQKIYIAGSILEIAILFVKVVQIERAP